MSHSENRLLPVLLTAAPAGERRSARPQSYPRLTGPYAAQLLGQVGQKRGLRGGASVLQAAHAAYLGTEYCGENDRRPPLGLVKRTSL